jgi:HAE1 family hydrophobic/amphiphilic exporter-1
MKLAKATSPLKRRDKSKIINLKGYLTKSTSGPVRRDLDRLFKAANLPEGTTYAYSGSAENESESQKELGKAFLLAVILTYMLLVAILNSFILPLSIGSAILTSFLGSFLVMYFTDQTINIGSMMAMVMVVGLSVNNAILIIEFAQQKLEEGIDIKEALWMGTSQKLKPILMTSVAIVAGTFPQLLDIDKIKSSMGAVIVGGMIGSVFFSYFFVPVIHYMVYNVMMKVKTLGKTKTA